MPSRWTRKLNTYTWSAGTISVSFSTRWIGNRRERWTGSSGNRIRFQRDWQSSARWWRTRSPANIQSEKRAAHESDAANSVGRTEAMEDIKQQRQCSTKSNRNCHLITNSIGNAIDWCSPKWQIRRNWSERRCPKPLSRASTARPSRARLALVWIVVSESLLEFPAFDLRMHRHRRDATMSIRCHSQRRTWTTRRTLYTKRDWFELMTITTISLNYPELSMQSSRTHVRQTWQRQRSSRAPRPARESCRRTHLPAHRRPSPMSTRWRWRGADFSLGRWALRWWNSSNSCQSMRAVQVNSTAIGRSSMIIASIVIARSMYKWNCVHTIHCKRTSPNRMTARETLLRFWCCRMWNIGHFLRKSNQIVNWLLLAMKGQFVQTFYGFNSMKLSHDMKGNANGVHIFRLLISKSSGRMHAQWLNCVHARSSFSVVSINLFELKWRGAKNASIFPISTVAMQSQCGQNTKQTNKRRMPHWLTRCFRQFRNASVCVRVFSFSFLLDRLNLRWFLSFA